MTTEDFAIQNDIKEDMQNTLVSADEYVTNTTYHYEEEIVMGEVQQIVVAKHWNDEGEIIRQYKVTISLEELPL